MKRILDSLGLQYREVLTQKGQWLIALCLFTAVRDAYWWRVRSVQTRKESYIPSNHVARVYHG